MQMRGLQYYILFPCFPFPIFGCTHYLYFPYDVYSRPLLLIKDQEPEPFEATEWTLVIETPQSPGMMNLRYTSNFTLRMHQYR